MELEEYIKRMEKAEKDFPKFLRNFLLKEAFKIQKQAENRSSVDTGYMKANWDVSKVRRVSDGWEVDIFNTAEYSSYQEYGTVRGIEPRYMVTVPLNRTQLHLQEKFDKAYTKWLKDRGLT